MTTTDSKTRYSCAETAKLVRIALKARFPSVKFSVRSSTYSMGASIDVSWTDGPSSKEVEPITSQFTGASFDGMIDLKSYHDTEWQGQRVHFGADYIFCSREISNRESTLAAAMLMLRRYYHGSIMAAREGEESKYDRIGNYSLEDHARQMVYSRKEGETLEESMKRGFTDGY